MATEVDAVVLCLPADGDVEEVMIGPEGILATAPSGLLIVDTSTIAPSTARRLAARCRAEEVAFVDAPVSGGPEGVARGSLAVMAGGEDEPVARARQVLQPVTGRFVHVGGPGSGQIAKACNQVAVAATIQVVVEALHLAEAAGADPRRVREALLGGFAASRVLEVHGQRMLDRDFVPGGRVRNQVKDLHLVAELCEEVDVEFPMAKLVLSLFEELVDLGGGDLDHAALYLRQVGMDP